MENEIADSVSEEDSGIDMDAAMDTIADGIFEQKVEKEEPEEATEEVSDEVEENEETEAEEVILKSAPQSWKKEMHEFWKGLDPTVQDYVEQREKQMAEGLEKDRGDANLGRTMRDVLEPFTPALEQNGINPHEMVKNLLNAQFRLAHGTPQERTQLIQQLAQSYGVTVNGEAAEVNPELQALREEMNSMKSQLTATQQREQNAQKVQIQSEVEVFASDPVNEYFDEVADQIIPLIKAGYELKDAYETAIWKNPVTRQKMQEKTSQEAAAKALEQAKQETEKAKKAKSANVKGRHTNKTPTESVGTMEDTMRETFRDIQTRSN